MRNATSASAYGAYVDDVVLQLPAEHTLDAVRILDAALHDVGLERRPDKCRWFVPGPSSTAHYPPDVGAPADGGLPILGSAADSAFSTVVSTHDRTNAATTQPAHDRLAQATQLAARITDLLHTEGDTPVLHAAFKLVTDVLNQALSYDICVLHAADIGALADQLDTLVLQVIRDIVGTDWSVKIRGAVTASSRQWRLRRHLHSGPCTHSIS